MKNTEQLLTNIPRILELKSAGFTYNDIAEFLNKNYQLTTNEKSIRNLLQYIKNDKLNKKYNTFALLPLSINAVDLLQYSIIEHGLIITTPAVARYYEMTHEVLDANNFRKKITEEEPLLYAKRLLRQYMIEDKELIQYLRKTQPSQPQVNYLEFIDYLHKNIANEVADWISQLKIKSSEFFTMKGKI